MRFRERLIQIQLLLLVVELKKVEIAKIKLPSGQALEFILAVPGRRYSDFTALLGTFQEKALCAEAEIIEELVHTQHSERAGRAQDHQERYAMQKLRAKGFL